MCFAMFSWLETSPRSRPHSGGPPGGKSGSRGLPWSLGSTLWVRVGWSGNSVGEPARGQFCSFMSLPEAGPNPVSKPRSPVRSPLTSQHPEPCVLRASGSGWPGARSQERFSEVPLSCLPPPDCFSPKITWKKILGYLHLLFLTPFLFKTFNIFWSSIPGHRTCSKISYLFL